MVGRPDGTVHVHVGNGICLVIDARVHTSRHANAPSLCAEVHSGTRGAFVSDLEDGEDGAAAEGAEGIVVHDLPALPSFERFV